MPFESKSQQRFMFAAEGRGQVPKGTAKRWAHETKNIKKLPQHKTKKASTAPVSFMAWLGQKAAAAPGVPEPNKFPMGQPLGATSVPPANKFPMGQPLGATSVPPANKFPPDQPLGPARAPAPNKFPSGAPLGAVRAPQQPGVLPGEPFGAVRAPAAGPAPQGGAPIIPQGKMPRLPAAGPPNAAPVMAQPKPGFGQQLAGALGGGAAAFGGGVSKALSRFTK